MTETLKRFAAKPLFVVAIILGLTACDMVPKEAVELSNTVGRDLEEVHRAHRALAVLHFGRIEEDANSFIDETYRPAFIKKFAEEFRLNQQVTTILANDPEKLLPVLTRFVETATVRVEAKREQLLKPIQDQRGQVVEEIDAAHRQIQAAQAVVTGHLASVRKVREVQNEILAKVGLGEFRQKVATRTAEISNKVADFVEKGEAIEAKGEGFARKIGEIDGAIDKLKSEISALGK